MPGCYDSGIIRKFFIPFNKGVEEIWNFESNALAWYGVLKPLFFYVKGPLDLRDQQESVEELVLRDHLDQLDLRDQLEALAQQDPEDP